MNSDLTDLERSAVNASLSALEKQKSAVVVYASVVGSHMRGLDSRNSDIDLFAIGVENPTTYLLHGDTQDYRDELSYDIGTGVEIKYWSLGALYDALVEDNPTAVEAIQSTNESIHNIHHSEWITVSSLVSSQTNTYQLLHHYRSLATNNYNRYMEGESEVDVKRATIVLDALLRSAYIEDTADLPPLKDGDLVSETKKYGHIPSDLQSLRTGMGNTLPELYYEICEQKSDHTASNTVSFERLTCPDHDSNSIIDAALDRDVAPYESNDYGSGINGELLAPLLEQIAERVWNVESVDNIRVRF